MADDDRYTREASTPFFWQIVARDFVCAANLLKSDYYARRGRGLARRHLSDTEALRRRHNSPRAMIVLYAVAIENMLKAVMVALGRNPVTTNGQLAGEFKTHDLVKLGRRANFPDGDPDLLEQLSAFIKDGKYPIGRRRSAVPRAHYYFPDVVVAGIERVLPKLEQHLASVPTARTRYSPVDLLRLGASRKLQWGKWTDEPRRRTRR